MRIFLNEKVPNFLQINGPALHEFCESAKKTLRLAKETASCPRKTQAKHPVMDTEISTSTATRSVECADSLPWMRERGRIEGACAVTSLPDVSEVSLRLEDWRGWFLEAAGLVIDSVPDESAAIFFQSDIKHDGAWIDKGALITRAAENANARILFHKIVCRRPPGTLTMGRPGFTHLIAVSRAMKCPDVLSIPDVIVEAGRQPWVRAMGVRAAAHAVRFARDHAGAKTIFDPFCGVGTILAVANKLGLDALGIEKARKRCEEARQLQVLSTEL